MSGDFDPKYKKEPICPPDLFERLNGTYHSPEHYNHLLARTIQELCDIVLTGPFTWIDGVAYIADPTRSKTISTHRATVTSGWYGLNQKDKYLRIEGVTTAGAAGFLVPRPAVITGLWAKSRSLGNWTIEIRKNGSPITLVSTAVTGGKGSDTNLDIDVDAGDFLQIYLNGAGVDHPIAAFELAWRLISP